MQVGFVDEKLPKIVLLVKVWDYVVTVPIKKSLIFCNIDLIYSIASYPILSKYASESKHYLSII